MKAAFGAQRGSRQVFGKAEQHDVAKSKAGDTQF